MDRAIDEGKTIQEMAKELSNAANKEQITLYMYGTAIRILNAFWEHGEKLRQWHNQEMKVESKGVVQPTIWTTKDVLMQSATSP